MSYEITPDTLVNFPRPSISDRWEKEISRLAGKNDYGKPMIRLVWGPDEHRIAFGKLRKKYLAAIVNKMTHWEEKTSKGTIRKYPPSGSPPLDLPIDSMVYPVYEKIDIGKPRWFLEEWWPPELVTHDWEENRYDWKDGIRVDVLGPAPTEGMYRTFLCIQTEDGKYREPNESDLETVRHLIYMRDQEKKEYGNRELQNDREAIQKLAEQYTAAIEEKDQEALDQFEETLKESIRPHIDKLVHNPEATWG